MKNVNFIIIRDREAESRPYMREWLAAGIPSPHATLAYVSAVQPDNRVLIFRLDKSDNPNLLKAFLTSPKASGNTEADGPLSPHPANPRYFRTPDGTPVYLTGAHTWPNLIDRGPAEPLPIFNFDEYLEFLQKNNHNFLRLWAWENARWAPWTTADYFYHPLPFIRSGPGLALDEKPRFDLTQFNSIYFDRLRHRVESAAKRGIYVSVMLFNGFSVDRKDYKAGNPWRGHPLNGANNVNGIDADRNHDGQGEEVHTLLDPGVVRIQEAYVQKVVDTVNDLSNVLFEICNECNKASTLWQYHMIEFIKNYEATRPKQHPVGMTSIWPGGNNVQLFRSPADWISPDTSTADFLRSPPPADGSKIILSDTDHLCGECGDRSWVWKSFTRGHNPIYMDRYREKAFYDPVAVDIRRNLGFTHSYANQINLASMLPMPKLCSSGYCLVSLSRRTAEYLVYSPDGAELTVDLSSTPGTLRGEWVDPSNGIVQKLGEVTGGEPQSFRVPFPGDAVLYLQEVKKDGVVNGGP
jgi:hypothetical protein